VLEFNASLSSFGCTESKGKVFPFNNGTEPEKLANILAEKQITKRTIRAAAAAECLTRRELTARRLPRFKTLNPNPGTVLGF
jgi:hypothetical protein